MSVPAFEVADAAVRIDGDPILTGVDLRVAAGEFLALLGENGSGKTTLLRALLGLQPLTSGTAKILGRPVAAGVDWSRVGFVPQHLLSAGAVPVSVREVVGAGLITPAGRWRRRADRQDRESDALRRVGLGDRSADAFSTLSGGQQRRVMIAASLAKGADLLLLDEPTAGVDEQSVAQLHAILAELKAGGATVVLVTHELGELTDLVDRVVVLGRGASASVRYDGPPPPPDMLRDPHGHHDPAPTAETRWDAP